ncbi:MAG: hypothetical protein HN793_11255 [Rhodospirillaceae bacterium]|nr:hypothetical protein [Rhodospirillaceae bacterium]MBT6960632.1 hypothetical protein [Rhodospirillaceae bacterium]MBT7451397.1 hypothetical protein [Rhodospirillaceae bacterium]
MISEDGKYVPYHSKTFTERKEAKAIMTTPDVNAKNVISIIDRIRSLSPKAKVVLTVSPIPLIKSFRPGGSAFVEDCVSKSIMRVAATMVMSQSIPDVFYWPSFEIVRWLTAHSGPVFGSDVELGSRHVNADVIDVVADLFIEKFTAPT